MLLLRRLILNHNQSVTLFKNSAKALCISPLQQRRISTEDNTQWRTIYQFPFIRLIAAINRLKIYQFGLAGISIPATHLLETSGHLTNTLPVVAAVGISGSLTLLIVSTVSSNLVGFIYVNEKNDKIKIAHVDFWGKRSNTEIPIASVVPMSESPKQIFNFYITITNYINKSKFKLLHHYGVVDYEKFSKIFGD